jgi:hypothetical protein
MRYELRTTFRLANRDVLPPGAIGDADRLLRWLYEYLPTQATMGCDVARPQWLGNRYAEPGVEFQLVTRYRNVFEATADRLRIEDAMSSPPSNPRIPEAELEFDLLVVYGEDELVWAGDPVKKITHP